MFRDLQRPVTLPNRNSSSSARRMRSKEDSSELGTSGARCSRSCLRPSHASAHHGALPSPQVLEELREASAIASRIVTLGPQRAFSRWRGFLDEKERLRSLTKRLLASGLARALNAWVDSLDKTGRRRLGRFARRMAQRALSKAWLCWVDLVEERSGALRHEPCPT